MTAGSLSVENSGTALRFACAEARQILLELAAAKLGVAVANLSVSDGTVTGSGQGHLLGARTRSEPGARGLGPGEAEATRAAQDSRPQHPAPRHPGQDDGRRRLRAGLAASRHGAWPRGAAATLWRQARQLRRGQGQGHAGSHRGGARRQLSRRGGAARGAGHQCAARADRVRQVVGRLRAARSGDAVRAAHVPAQRGQGDRREGRARAGRRQGDRGDVPSALSGACRDRALLRGGRVQGRQAYGLDPQPGRLPAACHPRQGARSGAARHPLHPRRRRRLLRPQRRRRRRLRRRHAGARRQWAAGAAAMDA